MLPKIPLDDRLKTLKKDWEGILEKANEIKTSTSKEEKMKAALCFFQSLNEINIVIVSFVDQEMRKD